MDKIIDSSSSSPENSASTLADSGFYWLERDGIKVLVSLSLEEAGFANGFSTRLGGVSPFPENDLNMAGFGEDTDANIAENRRRFLTSINGDHKLTTVWQIHSSSVKPVLTDEDVAATEQKHDAMVSDLPGILLGVKTADCVPILIGDPVTGAFSAVHAGWRGTAGRITLEAVRLLEEHYDADPADLIAAIGPAAGCERYEVGADVIELFKSNFSTSGNLFRETRPGHALIDLHKANSEQLIEAGINPNNISIAPFCTMERNDLFFSYRVEKRKYGKTGRLMSVIGRQ